jgi:hypothetical protein
VFAAWVAIRSRGPICERWCSFSNFYFDVGKRPSWRHLLIRDDQRIFSSQLPLAGCSAVSKAATSLDVDQRVPLDCV